MHCLRGQQAVLLYTVHAMPPLVLQPQPEVLYLFDDVLLLTDGRVMYQ
jgi:hypothetical protein